MNGQFELNEPFEDLTNTNSPAEVPLEMPISIEVVRKRYEESGVMPPLDME